MSSATACIKAIRICVLTAAQFGMSPLDVAKLLELDPELLQDSTARVHHGVVVRAWEELPKITGNANFGLHAAEIVAAAHFDIGPSMSCVKIMALRLERPDSCG